jgi:hypothetical protein
MRSAGHNPHGLHLPPGFRLVRLREVGDAFAEAVALAECAGAGTLVYVGRFDAIEFAVVLEPDEALRYARRAVYAGATALLSALLRHAPPERPIAFTWPDAICVDGGLVGGVRLAWPSGAAEEEPPLWVVFGGLVRFARLEEPVRGPSTALADEGFEDSGRLIESFARHLMRVVDLWQSRGFAVVADEFLRHLTPAKGASLSLDENGDLLVQWPGKSEPERRALREALEKPTWLDPETGSLRT